MSEKQRIVGYLNQKRDEWGNECQRLRKTNEPDTTAIAIADKVHEELGHIIEHINENCY